MEDDAHFEVWFDQEYRRVLSAVLVVCAGDDFPVGWSRGGIAED